MDVAARRLFARRMAIPISARQSAQIVSGGHVPERTRSCSLLFSSTRVDAVRVGHAGRIQNRRPG